MSGMKLTVIGEGLSPDRVEAMQAGLSAMGVAEVSVTVTDDFIAAVNGLISQEGYSTDRGAGVVAAKTISGDNGSVIVVNGQETRNRPPQLLERLLAHEAGHVLINERKELLKGRHELVDTGWEWDLLCLGGMAIEELRIERSLAERGYPVPETGTIEYAEDALYRLNVEVLEALLSPESEDTQKLIGSIMKTHDWLSKHLAYIAAYRSDTTESGLAGMSTFAKDHWNDYIDSTWESRVTLYETVPTALEPISGPDLDHLLQAAMRLEEAQLAQIGFRFATMGTDFSFTRVASDTRCNARLERARKEMPLSENT